MCHFSAWTTRAFLRRGEGPFKILLSALFFYPPFLGKLSLAFFSVLMSWEMLHMLSSPPDVVLKEEGTIAASEAFLPQGCRFFPHPPVLLHGHLCIWHCPSRKNHSFLPSLPCWASCGLSMRLAMTYGVTQRPALPLSSIRTHFFFPHAPVSKDGAASQWPYWDAKIAILHSDFLFSEVTECCRTPFLFIICDMASLFLSIGVSGTGRAVVIFLTGLYVYVTVRVIICLVFYCLS